MWITDSSKVVCITKTVKVRCLLLVFQRFVRIPEEISYNSYHLAEWKNRDMICFICLHKKTLLFLQFYLFVRTIVFPRLSACSRKSAGSKEVIMIFCFLNNESRLSTGARQMLKLCGALIRGNMVTYNIHRFLDFHEPGFEWSTIFLFMKVLRGYKVKPYC